MNKKSEKIISFLHLPPVTDRVPWWNRQNAQKKLEMKKACCKEIIIKGNVINYTINQMTKEKKSNFLFIHILFCSMPVYYNFQREELCS